MSEYKNKRNFFVPLGTYRHEPDLRNADPAWLLIHKLRQANGVSTTELSEVSGVAQTTISKGERGGHVSLQATRKALGVFGYDLKIVPKEENSNV
jgi:helix-turn-helix protein